VICLPSPIVTPFHRPVKRHRRALPPFSSATRPNCSPASRAMPSPAASIAGGGAACSASIFHAGMSPGTSDPSAVPAALRLLARAGLERSAAGRADGGGRGAYWRREACAVGDRCLARDAPPTPFAQRRRRRRWRPASPSRHSAASPQPVAECGPAPAADLAQPPGTCRRVPRSAAPCRRGRWLQPPAASRSSAVTAGLANAAGPPCGRRRSTRRRPAPLTRPAAIADHPAAACRHRDHAPKMHPRRRSRPCCDPSTSGPPLRPFLRPFLSRFSIRFAATRTGRALGRPHPDGAANPLPAGTASPAGDDPPPFSPAVSQTVSPAAAARTAPQAAQTISQPVAAARHGDHRPAD
jgi:hypothetical protein